MLVPGGFGLKLWIMLVSAYSRLKKLDTERGAEGRFRTFTALRAVGLACELGHKVCSKNGLGSLVAADLGIVSVSGSLQLQDGGKWRAARACSLKLQHSDAGLAKTLVEKQRALLGDLHLNVWAVDVPISGQLGYYDLLADFSTQRNFGVTGRVWIELKVFGVSSFSRQVTDARKHLEETLVKVGDTTVGAVLLLVARVEKVGVAWGAPALTASLYKRGSDGWVDVVGPVKRVARGRCKITKPSLASVWEKMEWIDLVGPTPRKVGLLKHFLLAFELQGQTVGERAETYNHKLQRSSHAGRLFVARVKRAGRAPWVADKATFRALYDHV
jgi:hypothetical protein